MAFFFCHFRSTESVKFHFEECGSDVDEREWMFCHVPGCSFWTSKSWRMERHKLCHSFETSPLESSGSNKRCYKCPDCHLKFFSLAKLLKHDRKKHTGVKDYECRICGAEVTDIQTHMRVIILYWASFFSEGLLVVTTSGTGSVLPPPFFEYINVALLLCTTL